MTNPRLVDAVTLRHFGITEHLATLKHVLSMYLPPYWTDAVRSEILAGIGQPDCNNVLAASFLGVPHQIPTANLAGNWSGACDPLMIRRLRASKDDRRRA